MLLTMIQCAQPSQGLLYDSSSRYVAELSEYRIRGSTELIVYGLTTYL